MDDVDGVCDDVWAGTNGEELAEHTGCPGCCYVFGAAAIMGLIRMAQVIGARERAKPLAPLEGKQCASRNPEDRRRRCSYMAGHTGHHRRLSWKGNVLTEWPNAESPHRSQPK